MTEPERAVPLGGLKAGQVVRVGDTVCRPVGAWSPIVHALLRHLEEREFDGAPRFVGIDGARREVLTFHPGVLMTEHPDAAADDLLAEVAAVVRAFHAAAADFTPPPGQPRWAGSLDPAGGASVLHGDLAPWNVIVGTDHLTLIDWDDVWVGRIEWEVAYALHTFVPFWPDGLSDRETVRRIRVFADAYGLRDDEMRAALELVPARCRTVGEATRAHAALGDEAFIGFVAQGIDAYWLSSADHVESRLPSWQRALGI
ncbi:MAG TPA: phosphotransferase [Acidimicrobiales bacterium]